jgi:hypothetical protein
VKAIEPPDAKEDPPELNLTTPPFPEFPLPTETKIDPPRPELEIPVTMATNPLFPFDAAPLLKTIRPDELDFAV